MPTVTPSHIRGARGMFGWSAVDLARAAAVSVSRIKRIGSGQQKPLSIDVRSAVGNALAA